jgi:hypothetical protein
MSIKPGDLHVSGRKRLADDALGTNECVILIELVVLISEKLLVKLRGWTATVVSAEVVVRMRMKNRSEGTEESSVFPRRMVMRDDTVTESFTAVVSNSFHGSSMMKRVGNVVVATRKRWDRLCLITCSNSVVKTHLDDEESIIDNRRKMRVEDWKARERNINEHTTWKFDLVDEACCAGTSNVVSDHEVGRKREN